MTDIEATRHQLLEQDPQFRQLSSDHHALDDQLRSLSSKPHLSDDEQLEEVRIKKEKLRVKDQMEALVRRHQDISSLPV